MKKISVKNFSILKSCIVECWINKTANIDEEIIRRAQYVWSV